MSWLTQRPQTSDPTNYYTVGLNRTLLFIGLGNPGKGYDLTRHNVGFFCIDEFVSKATEMESWVQKKDLKCLVSTGRLGENRIIAIKPTTFMNLSGDAVQAAVHFYKISLDNIVVIQDELDLEFGQVRMRGSGSAAGHNGIKSVSRQLGENFGRIRIGIGPKKPARIKSEDFVLQKFSEDEQAQLPNMAREVNSILTEYIYGSELPHETRGFLI